MIVAKMIVKKNNTNKPRRGNIIVDMIVDEML